MPIIRRHRTVYNTAKIILLLCLVLFNSQKVGFALSFWDAIFEIGFNSGADRIDSKAACQQIERLITLPENFEANRLTIRLKSSSLSTPVEQSMEWQSLFNQALPGKEENSLLQPAPGS